MRISTLEKLGHTSFCTSHLWGQILSRVLHPPVRTLHTLHLSLLTARVLPESHLIFSFVFLLVFCSREMKDLRGHRESLAWR